MDCVENQPLIAKVLANDCKNVTMFFQRSPTQRICQSQITNIKPSIYICEEKCDVIRNPIETELESRPSQYEANNKRLSTPCLINDLEGRSEENTKHSPTC